MIRVEKLSKRYGSVPAVDNLSFDVHPGVVTGFLGPNGAGKSTTLRMILGLDRPDAGRATLGGVRYANLREPARAVGALLDAAALQPARTARDHLRWLAAAAGIGPARVSEVLDLVGLSADSARPVAQFSLGMRQRLGLAAALLGDPRRLILDEPTNGLDPQGILWLRATLRRLAAEGRTILVSSHLMTEIELGADRVIIINRGRLAGDIDLHELKGRTARPLVRLLTPAADTLALHVEAAGGTAAGNGHRLEVTGLSAAQVGELALQHGIALHELTTVQQSLEETFMTLTANSTSQESRR
jgi:ABC-2 type transport system ATP-binding protein